VVGKGSASGGVGVFGFGGNATSAGVVGMAGTGGIGTPNLPVVNVGVYGIATNGIGVQGVIPSDSSAANTNAVQGLNQSTGANSNGVYGVSTSGYGVIGYSTGGTASLAGISTNVNIPAFAGGNSVAGGLAASFSGTVYINGRLVVVDPSYKSGLLAHPDGSHRLVYCVESPESWIEDFGKGQLVSGKADVRLDPDFAAVVQTDDYHIFLTTYGPSQGLDVVSQGIAGFTVQERNKGTSGVPFGYRVVAKPKTDKKLSRLEKFSPPNVKLPDPASFPKPSAGPPKIPDTRQPPPQPAPQPRQG
jgi:hypothetical protein